MHLEWISRERRLTGETDDLLERSVQLEYLALGSVKIGRCFVVQSIDVCRREQSSRELCDVLCVIKELVQPVS